MGGGVVGEVGGPMVEGGVGVMAAAAVGVVMACLAEEEGEVIGAAGVVGGVDVVECNPKKKSFTVDPSISRSKYLCQTKQCWRLPRLKVAGICTTAWRGLNIPLLWMSFRLVDATRLIYRI